MKRTKTTPPAVAAALVAGHFAEHLATLADPDEYLDVTEDPALMRALRAEEPPRARKDDLTSEEWVALYERVQALLPDDDARRQLFLYNEANDRERDRLRQAAFLVGVEVGRRLAVLPCATLSQRRGTTTARSGVCAGVDRGDA